MVRTKRSVEAFRFGADARDLNAAAGQVTQDQHGDAGQAAWRPDLDSEEVGGGAHVPVGRETLPPGRALLAFGGGFEAALLAHVGEGAPRDLMTEVAAGTPTTGVAPLAVLGGHPDDEPADRVHDPWAARSATAAAVVCPRDQLSMPAEEGLGRDQGVPVTAYPSPEARGLCGPAPALGVGDPETARTALLSADAILFLERVNDVTRLLVDPARDGHDEELQHVGNRRHTGRAEQRLSAVTNVATRRASSVESARRTASIGFLETVRHRTVVVRMRLHQPTVDDVARRTAGGRTRREIIRCLKRFLAREIYQCVMADFRMRRHVTQAA